MVLLFDSSFFSFLARNMREGAAAKKIFVRASQLLKKKPVIALLFLFERVVSFFLCLPIPLYSLFIRVLVEHADGYCGYYLRALYYCRKLKEFKGNIIIEQQVVLKKPQAYRIDRFVMLDIGCKILCDEAVIESGCHLAPNSLVTGGGRLIMKKYSGLSHNCIVITATDTIEDGHRHSGPMIPEEQRRVKRLTTVIEQDAWPAVNVIIFPGVTIGEGAVLAPGSVVSKDIPPWSVWGLPRIKQYGFREKVKFNDPEYI